MSRAARYARRKHAHALAQFGVIPTRLARAPRAQVDFGNVVSAISAAMAVGMPQADGSMRAEPRMSQEEAADCVHAMAALPLTANVQQMTVLATKMPFVGRG